MVAREQPLVAREWTVNLFFLLILKEIGLTFEEDAKTVAKREFSQMSLDCKKKKKKDMQLTLLIFAGDSCMMAADKLRDLLQRLNLETDPS